MLDKILAPSRELDPNAIYVPAPRWTFAVTGDLRQASFSQTQDFTLPSAKLSPSGELIIQETPVHLFANLRGKLGTAAGVQVGYGDLCFSLSKNLGGEDTEHVFSFDYQSAGYALQVQYFSYLNPVNYHQTFAEERLGKAVKGKRILIAHGNGTEGVADVESEQDAQMSQAKGAAATVGRYCRMESILARRRMMARESSSGETLGSLKWYWAIQGMAKSKARRAMKRFTGRIE